MLSRRGVTLVEMMVTMVIGGIALALVAAVSLRQQRVLADLAGVAASSAQLRDAAAILPIDLRSVSSAAGDIREALDTALEVRATVATGVVCDTAAGALVLAPGVDGAATYAGISSAIETADTAWILVPVDTGESWTPHAIAASNVAPPGGCAALGPRLADSVRAMPRTSLSLAGLSPPTSLGAALRVTRATRYSLYRGSDGAWYLGQRDWNAVMARFNAIQPVAGPFLSPAKGGITFRYYDSVGTELSVPVTNTRAVAVVHIDLRSQTRSPMRALGAAPGGRRDDSASVWVLLRNRR